MITRAFSRGGNFLTASASWFLAFFPVFFYIFHEWLGLFGICLCRRHHHYHTKTTLLHTQNITHHHFHHHCHPKKKPTDRPVRVISITTVLFVPCQIVVVILRPIFYSFVLFSCFFAASSGSYFSSSPSFFSVVVVVG